MDLTPIEKLNILLDRDKISYTELAGRVGSSRQAVSQAMNNKNITIKKLEAFAAAAGYKMIVEFEKITPEK